MFIIAINLNQIFFLWLLSKELKKDTKSFSWNFCATFFHGDVPGHKWAKILMIFIFIFWPTKKKQTQVEKSDSCQYLQKAQYRASCKQGTMPVLVSWYLTEGWRGTGIVQSQSWDQVSANNQILSNASTEPVQSLVLAWYQCPVKCQYRWTTSRQVTFRSRAGGRPCLCQHYASTAPVHQILLRYRCGNRPVVNKKQCLYWSVGTSPRVGVVLA